MSAPAHWKASERAPVVASRRVLLVVEWGPVALGPGRGREARGRSVAVARPIECAGALVGPLAGLVGGGLERPSSAGARGSVSTLWKFQQGPADEEENNPTEHFARHQFPSRMARPSSDSSMSQATSHTRRSRFAPWSASSASLHAPYRARMRRTIRSRMYRPQSYSARRGQGGVSSARASRRRRARLAGVCNSDHIHAQRTTGPTVRPGPWWWVVVDQIVSTASMPAACRSSLTSQPSVRRRCPPGPAITAASSLHTYAR